jgi:hypothetical protein
MRVGNLWTFGKEVGAGTYYCVSDGGKETLKVRTSLRYPFSISLRSILLNWHNRRGKETVSGTARNSCDNVSSC